MAISGNNARGVYGWETTFKTISGTMNKIFGTGMKFSSISRNNNAKLHYGINNAEAVNSSLGTYSVSITAESDLTNPWWLRAITGNTAVTTGAGPYVHTYVNSAGSPATISKTPQPFSLSVGYDLDTDLETNFLGCIMKSVSLSCKTGEPVAMSYEIEAATETHDTTLTTAVTETENPLTFAHASLELPTGTSIGKIDNLDISINRNTELKPGLGSRFPQSLATKLTEYEVKFDLPLETATLLQSAIGNSGGATNNVSELANLKVIIDNGEATTNQRALDLRWSGIRLSEISIPTTDDGVIMQDITCKPRVLTYAVATNNTATAL